MKLLYCSFCGKSQHEVKKIIAGPSAFICEECIGRCNDMIREEAHPVTRENSDDETSLFLKAVQGVEPLPAVDKVIHSRKPPRPIIKRAPRDRDSTAYSSFPDQNNLPEMEAGDEHSFLRSGVSRQTLKKLRRGYWKINDKLDLHGLTRDEALQELVEFLSACNKRGFRCVLVVHGKGLNSKNSEPVLKTMVWNRLKQHNYVLAFCQAGPSGGGSGAVLVLLKSISKKGK